jgi:hypothetical protein
MTRLSRAVGLLLVALAAGCGESKTCEVSGTVTWNGEALPEGDILFVPADGKGPPAATKVRGGGFKLQVPPGKKKVEVHASRPAGPVDPVMKTARREPYIPRRYNDQTVLEADVTRGGGNHFTFALDDKPAASR